MRHQSLFAALIALTCLGPTVHAQTALGPGFPYQGQLNQSGLPVNGTVNLRFTLWDSAGTGSPPVGGNQIGIPQLLTGVPITNGLFTVTLNASNQFGLNPFNGQARFLQVEVCADSNCTSRTTLAPRQPLAATPYASFAAAPWIKPASGGADLAYAAGNVGIGTTSPTSRLSVAGDLDISGSRLHVGANGNIGIATASPTATLHVNGNLGLGLANIPAGLTSELGGTNTPILNFDVNFRHPNRSTSFIGGAFRIDARNDTPDPLFQLLSRPPNSSTETIIASLTQDGRMNLNGGLNINVLAGVRPNLQISGIDFDNIYFALSGHSHVGFIRYTAVFEHILLGNDASFGFAELQNDGSWSTLSDARMKASIAPAQGLLAKALALHPAEFFMLGQDRTREPDKCLGLIAQEVQPIFPSLVHTTSGGMLTLNYDRIGIVAIGAIQEQQAIIADHDQRVTALEATASEQQDLLRRQQAQIDNLTQKLASLAASRANPTPPSQQNPVTPAKGKQP